MQRYFPFSISAAVLKDRDGNIVGGVESFRDLSALEELKKEITRTYTFEDIVSKNHRILQIFDILSNVAENDTTVLLQGASGTGKELFARAIHNLSPRKKGPFIASNCGALPDTLLESELFFRLNVIRIDLPPLVERRDDIPLLIDHFIDKFNRKMERQIERVSDDVLALLMRYPFPGNVRELENIIEHAFVMCREHEIQLDHLPSELFHEFAPTEMRKAVILAHVYQRGEVQAVADYVGDSLELSKKAVDTQAEVIVFCGVQFMAETAAILNPAKIVLLPDQNAGCGLADMATREQLKAMKRRHPDKHFYPVNTLCEGMNTVTLQKLHSALERMQYRVEIPERIPIKRK